MKDIKDNMIVLHSINKISRLETFKEKISHSLFNLLIVLLKNQQINIWFETISLVFQLLQLIAFPFNPIVTILFFTN